MCSVLSQSQFVVCRHPWKPGNTRFSVITFIVIISCLNGAKIFFITLNVIMTVGLTSLKIRKACCEPEKVIKK